MVEEKKLERQMGCMAGFFQLFDRQQILAGKRIYSTKRLPSSTGTSSPSQSEVSDSSTPSVSKEPPPPVAEKPRPARPLPVFDTKEGSKVTWKLREAPRLSLDSRLLERKRKLFPPEIRIAPVSTGPEGVCDEQHRSPSVVARLMGLDALPKSSDENSGPMELRRSASESRATRLHYSFVHENVERETVVRDTKPMVMPSPPAKKSAYFNSQDFFPEPAKKVNNGNGIYGEFEKRLRKRGIEEPAKDLETLKQVLEALQLKGLLHAGKPQGSRNARMDGRNLIREPEVRSPIVLMKPNSVTRSPRRNRLPPAPQPSRNIGGGDQRARRDHGEVIGWNGRMSPEARSPSSSARRSNVDRERGRVSPAQSPRSGASPRRGAGSDPRSTSSRVRKTPIRCHDPRFFSDEASTVSESSYSTCSQLDLERVKTDEYREGRNLLERCDKLLNSIAEITIASTTTTGLCCSGLEELPNIEQHHPSPVSVLDSDVFDCDAASPAIKRRIDFKGENVEMGEEQWTPFVQLLPVDEAEAVDHDFAYLVEIFSLSDPTQAAPLDVYLSLEKHHQGMDSSKDLCLHRRLVFDTVVEIIERKRRVSSWEAFSRSKSCASISRSIRARETWTELKRIREPVPSDDLLELVCGVMRKDMTADDGGWAKRSIEMSDAVLDIERLIFKDLVADTIKDLSLALSATKRTRPTSGKNTAYRRKLVF